MFNLTSHSHQTRSRHRNRCTPRQCALTGWWPRHCQRARALPPAHAAPAPSSAEFLQRHLLSDKAFQARDFISDTVIGKSVVFPQNTQKEGVGEKTSIEIREPP